MDALFEQYVDNKINHWQLSGRLQVKTTKELIGNGGFLLLCRLLNLFKENLASLRKEMYFCEIC